MIIELKPENFLNILPLYRGCYPLLLAVIRGKQRGQIFADKSSAVVIANSGFTGLFGTEYNEEFNVGLAELFAGNTIKPNYLLWYSPPDYWQEQLTSARRRKRIRFEFRGEHKELKCPIGFELRTDLVPKLADRFWSSDFCKYGLSVCLVKDGEIVSLCYSACVVDGLVEIDIITQEGHRGQGLGTFVGQQFVNECIRRGLVPTWDCFVYNGASIRLAEKLGFVKQQTYPFYSFNIPLEIR